MGQLSAISFQLVAESKLLFEDLSLRNWVRRELKINWLEYIAAFLLVATVTAVGFLVQWQDATANLIMLYLLCVVYCATTMSRGAAIFASIIGVASFDYFFVPPYFAFAPSDSRYFFSLGALLIVALLISELPARTRARAVLAQEQARLAEVQYFLSRDLLSTTAIDELVCLASRRAGEVFHCQSAIWLPNGEGDKIALASGQQALEADMVAAAQECFNLKQAVRRSHSGTGSCSELFLPLLASQQAVGVLGLLSSEAINLDPPQMNLLLAFANHTAVALERAILWQATEAANLRVEQERLRSALLSSVSHDLRTPLSSITGAASSLLASFDSMNREIAKELIQSIYDEAERLNRFLSNLLDMTRLQAGIINLKTDWYSLEEVVGAAISRVEKRLNKHRIVTKLPGDLPLIEIDPTLIEQLFINLLDNAAKYSDPGNEIRITAYATSSLFSVEVFNSGSQLPLGDEVRVFEKFYRGRQTLSGCGVGLGLAICKAIVQAHGGQIFAENMSSTGVNFLITLPIKREAPRVDLELEPEAGG